MHRKFTIKNIETILDLTNDAISVADEKGNTILVNAAYTKITGLPKEAVINKPVTVDIAEGESMHIKVLKTGKAVRNVHMKVGPARKEVIVNVEPIYIDGKLKGSVRGFIAGQRNLSVSYRAYSSSLEVEDFLKL